MKIRSIFKLLSTNLFSRHILKTIDHVHSLIFETVSVTQVTDNKIIKSTQNFDITRHCWSVSCNILSFIFQIVIHSWIFSKLFYKRIFQLSVTQDDTQQRTDKTKPSTDQLPKPSMALTMYFANMQII